MSLDRFSLCGQAPSVPLEELPERRVKRFVLFLNRDSTAGVVRHSFRVLRSVRVCDVRCHRSLHVSATHHLEWFIKDVWCASVLELGHSPRQKFHIFVFFFRGVTRCLREGGALRLSCSVACVERRDKGLFHSVSTILQLC